MYSRAILAAVLAATLGGCAAAPMLAGEAVYPLLATGAVYARDRLMPKNTEAVCPIPAHAA